MLAKILVYLLITTHCFAQKPKEGDNLYSLLEAADTSFSKTAAISHWPEGTNIRLLAVKNANKSPNYLILVNSDRVCFGVLDESRVLLDLNGDSLLDKEVEAVWMPHWIIKNKSIADPKDRIILSWMEKSYEQMLQANEGSLDNKLARQYEQFRSDPKIANRYIFYLYDSYQVLITSSSYDGDAPPVQLALLIIESLTEECLNLYGRVPTVVAIYKGEALLSAGMIEEAREHFKQSREIYPQSIPIKVYNYRLEVNEVEKERQYQELKKKYSKHWMVKSL